MTGPILVADFDFTRRYVIAQVLRQAGHHVVETADATEAEALLMQGRCSLAFIAARLSGRDGFELCKQFTQRGVRIVLVSTDFRGSELYRARAHEVGAVALLSTTADRERVEALVNRLAGHGNLSPSR